MRSKIMIMSCILICSVLISYGIYLKVYGLKDANAYLLGGGVPFLGYLLSLWLKKLGIQK